MASQFPERENDLVAFVQGFDAVYSAHPERYLATRGEADSVHGVIASYVAAAAVASQVGTRTRASVTWRNEAKCEMLAVLRPTVRLIMDNLGIEPADKELLGLRLPDTTLTRIGAPTSAPHLAIIAATPLEHLLRFHDPGSPTRRAKPAGTNGMQLVRIIADFPAPAIGPEGAELVAIVTRQPYVVRFVEAHARKTAYYWARWQNPRGEPGPWSPRASMVIPGLM